MIFHGFIEALLGSKVKVKVVQYLMHEETPVSERELAKLLRVSHTAISQTMKELCELNLIQLICIGHVNIWSLNKMSFAYNTLHNCSLFNKNESYEPLQDLKKKIREYLEEFKPEKAIIYGSISKGMEKSNSDIDFLIIFKTPQDAKKADNATDRLAGYCINTYGNNFNCRVMYSEKMTKTDKKILDEARDGITVIP